MELTFQKSSVPHLQKLTSQVLSQEETLEVTIPESLPDIGRVVAAWGVPVIRGKELRQNGMGVSGGVTAWVLYVPEDGTGPRQISSYLPFSMKWDIPQGSPEGTMSVSCRLKSIDARMVSSRKLLVRANLSCKGEAYCPAEAQLATLAAPPKDLEVLRSRLLLQLPAEMTEKTFLVDEELELPTGTPAAAQIIAYQLSPRLTDSKVLGEKAVFKGSCGLHLVYMTPEDRLAVWDFDIPFSQYTELEKHYDQEEELQTELLLTGAEVTADEEGRRLNLKCSLAAQCLVLSRQTVDLVQDLYSLNRTVTPKAQTIPIKTRLDRQSLRAQAEETFPIGAGTLVDCTLLPGHPRNRREGENVTIETPLWCGILYYDGSGQLQGSTGSTSAAASIRLAEDCPVEASACLSGPVQWSLGGGTASVRGTVEIIADSFANRDLTAITGADLGEETPRDPERPSLILRAPGSDANLWILAKSCGSTVEAIRGANQLGEAHLDPDQLLLIPVL